MHYRWRYGVMLLVLGCGGRIIPDPGPEGAPGPDGGAAAWDGGSSGLPCDVAALIAAKCIGCHGPSSSSVVLTTRDAFLAPSSVSGETVGQRAAQRMASLTSPMPPAGSPAPTAAEESAFSAWVTAGMPLGDCGGIDAGVIEKTCASQSLWTGGNRGSKEMNPGLACINCHTARGEQELRYIFAGTVYPALHELDRCNARPPNDVRVEIYDQYGTLALTLTPDATSGNFHSSTNVSVALPYTARVVSAKGTSTMTQPQVNGDCNSCHTALGTNGAPGRLIWVP